MLQSSKKNIVDKKFSNAFAEWRVRPSGKVWWRITAALDQKGSSRKGLKYGILILLILVTGSALIINHYVTVNSLNKVIAGNEIEGVSVADVMSDSPINSALPINETGISGGAKQQYSTIKISHKKEASAEDLLSEMNSDNWQLTRDMSILNEPLVILKSNEEDEMLGDIVKPVYNPKIQVAAGGYMGASLLLNNTWLIDRHAMSSENFKYKLTYGVEFGLEGGFFISRRFGIAAGWYIHSAQGQRYKNIDQYERTTSLEYRDKQISFTYINLPVLMQYRIQKYSDFLNAPVNVNLILGGQYGRMISYSNEDIKGEIGNNELFYKNDFAIVSGIDYHILSNRPMFYTIGFRASYGSNVFNAEVPNDYEFDKPHNFLIGIHTAFNFSLDKQGFLNYQP